MKKIILLAAILMTGTSVFAASPASKFMGNFSLVDSKIDGETFCFQGITIAEEDDGLISLYRSDMSGYGPMISAELNGEPRENSASHGEALSGRKGKDTVTLENGVLTFKYKGVNNFMGIPTTRESDTISIALAKDGKTLAVTRSTFEGPVVGIGKKAKALCAYQK